jgi:16S rRNA (guanine966-N2)-methyltransferase
MAGRRKSGSTGKIKIIGGQWRGRQIQTPAGRNTRPTLNRVREALFNIIQHEVPGCCFIDLFAGSGAVGFEALSRGASQVIFVESNPAAQATLRNNREILGADTGCTVINESVITLNSETLLKPANEHKGEFIIFADPPYAERDAVIVSLETQQLLEECYREVRPTYTIIQARRGGTVPKDWATVRVAQYGESSLYFVHPEKVT